MKLYHALILSIGVHLILAWSSLITNAPKLQHSSELPIEVQYTDDTNRNKLREFVEQADVPSIEVLKEKTNLLSKRLQRVKKQLVAKQSGKTENRTPQIQQKTQEQESHNKPYEKSALSDLDQRIREMAANEKRDLTTQRRLQIPPSTISQYIPNVDQGEFTALNTDQFVYYTFYSRVNEQIRNRWISHLREIHDSASPSRIIKMSLKPTITEIEVLLDSQGKYLETIVHRGSGFHDIDLAAIESFIKASPLNHPPSEMVKEDGKIHLHYSFYIQWSPNTLAHRGK